MHIWCINLTEDDASAILCYTNNNQVSVSF